MLPPTCTRLSEVCDALARKYPDVPPEELHDDVAELLEALMSQGLVLPAAAS
jgi:hypothetical protein